MSEIATLSSDLPTITAEINAYKRVAGEAIFEIGRRLKSVRDAKSDSTDPEARKLARQREEAGGWIRWLEESVDFKRSQAHMFIEAYTTLGADVCTFKHTGLRALYEIATLPPEERTREHTLKSGATKTVDEMTVRELREVKAALKAEREARELAEARAEKAEGDYEIVRETLDSVCTTYVDDGLYRIDNQTEVNGAALFFSDKVRDLVKEFSYLTSYCTELAKASDESRVEYCSALEALEEFVSSLRKSLEVVSADSVIIMDQTQYRGAC